MSGFPEVALCQSVGDELRDAVRDGLAAIGAADLGTKDLAERLGTTQVFTSRLRKMLACERGEEAILSSPGVGPLRKLQLTLVKAGLEGSAADRLLAAIVSFDRLLRLEIGDRRTLETLLIDFVPGGREAFEVSRRQAAFRALAEGRGLSAHIVVDTTIVVPGLTEGRASVATVASIHGLERHAEGSEFGFDLQSVPLTGEGERGASSRSVDLASLDLQPYLDGPAAPTEVVSLGEGRQRLELGETAIGPAGSVDLAFVDLLEDAVPAGLPSPGDPRRFAVTSGLASRCLVTEVLVPRGMFGDAPPALRHATTSGVGLLDVLHPEFPSLLRSIHQSLEPLDPSPRSLRVEGAAHRHELTVRVVELLGHRLDEFEVHRLTMPFPFPWSRFFHCWFHPEDPLRGVTAPTFGSDATP